jgi:hypothetical protein
LHVPPQYVWYSVQRTGEKRHPTLVVYGGGAARTAAQDGENVGGRVTVGTTCPA